MLDVTILGSLKIYVDGRPVRLARRQQRRLLGALLLTPSVEIPADRLAGILWDEAQQPRSPAATMSTYASRIRRDLGPAGAALGSGPDGYIMRIDPLRVDASRFLDRVRQVSAVDDLGQRSEQLREALALWHGPVLADAFDDRLRGRLCLHLDSARTAAYELLFEAELARGRHAEVLADIVSAAELYPDSERLVRHQMLALSRCGHRAQALRIYRETRKRLRDELGLDPSAEMERLHEQLLREQPADPVRPVPWQSAPQAGRLYGRGGVLASTDAYLDRHRAADDTIGPAAILLTGPPGVGKTAVARAVAERRRTAFPDGVLWARLTGADGRAVPPEAVLRQFLRDLGWPVDQPMSPPELAGRWRSVTADAAILLVLDDAASASQVRDLLPGGPAGAVVATSRDNFGLHGLQVVPLPPLDPAAAVQMLRDLIGDGRLAGEALDDLAAACGHLPLALLTTSASIAARPQWTVEEIRSRLGPPVPPAVAVGAALGRSIVGLSEPAGQVLRRLAELAWPRYPVWLAPLLAADTRGTPDGTWRELVTASLLDPAGSVCGTPTYEIHPAVRHVVLDRRDRSELTDPILSQVYATLAWSTALADSVLPGRRFPTPAVEPCPIAADERLIAADPSAWIDAHLPAIQAGLVQLASRGLYAAAAGLATVAVNHVASQVPDELLPLTELAQQAAAQPDVPASTQAAAMLAYAEALRLGEQFAESIRAARVARRMYRHLGDRHRAGLAAAVLGASGRMRGCRRTALAAGLTAVAGLTDRVTSQHGSVWLALANSAREFGADLEAVRQLLDVALAAFHADGDLPGQVNALATVAMMLLHGGQAEEAVKVLESAHDLLAPTGDRVSLPFITMYLAEALLAAGYADRACRHAVIARQHFSRTGFHMGLARCLSVLGQAEMDRGRPDVAVPQLRQAVDHAEIAGNEHLTGWIRFELAQVLHAAGAGRQARFVAAEALATLQAISSFKAVRVEQWIEAHRSGR